MVQLAARGLCKRLKATSAKYLHFWSGKIIEILGILLVHIFRNPAETKISDIVLCYLEFQPIIFSMPFNLKSS